MWKEDSYVEIYCIKYVENLFSNHNSRVCMCVCVCTNSYKKQIIKMRAFCFPKGESNVENLVHGAK